MHANQTYGAAGGTRQAPGPHWSLEELKREYILSIVHQTHGAPSRAARILGIDRRTLSTKLRRYLSGE